MLSFFGSRGPQGLDLPSPFGRKFQLSSFEQFRYSTDVIVIAERMNCFFNPILPGLLNTLRTWGVGRIPPPANLLVF